MVSSGTNRAEPLKSAWADGKLRVLIGPKHLKVHGWMITSGTYRAETLKGA